jgi:hypothetical protein
MWQVLCGSMLEKAMNNLKADLYVKLDAITVRVNNETRMAATTGIDQRVKIASILASTRVAKDSS